MNTETTETPLNRNDEPATIAALAAVAKELLKLVAARAKHENPGEYFEADSRLKSGECFPRVTIDFRHGEHTVAVKSVNDSDGEDDHLLGQFDSRKASLNS